MDYESIGDEVSVEGSIVQAAQALDFAGQYAQEARNVEKLLQVAEAWQNVADFIIDFSEKEAKLEEKGKKSETPFGFHVKSDADNEETETEEVEEEDAGSTSNDSDQDSEDGANEGSSGDGVHEEHGQLRVNEDRRGRRRLSTRR